jgi:hypothetical protein
MECANDGTSIGVTALHRSQRRCKHGNAVTLMDDGIEAASGCSRQKTEVIFSGK